MRKLKRNTKAGREQQPVFSPHEAEQRAACASNVADILGRQRDESDHHEQVAHYRGEIENMTRELSAQYPTANPDAIRKLVLAELSETVSANGIDVSELINSDEASDATAQPAVDIRVPEFGPLLSAKTLDAIYSHQLPDLPPLPDITALLRPLPPQD